MPNVISAHVERRVFPLTQPLPPDAWNEVASLSGKTTIPLMLDESISILDDVTHAAKVGCKFIKLKRKGYGKTQKGAKNSMKTKILGIAGSLRNARWGKGNHLKIKISAQRGRLMYTNLAKGNDFSTLV